MMTQLMIVTASIPPSHPPLLCTAGTRVRRVASSSSSLYMWHVCICIYTVYNSGCDQQQRRERGGKKRLNSRREHEIRFMVLIALTQFKSPADRKSRRRRNKQSPPLCGRGVLQCARGRKAKKNRKFHLHSILHFPNFFFLFSRMAEIHRFPRSYRTRRKQTGRGLSRRPGVRIGERKKRLGDQTVDICVTAVGILFSAYSSR